MDGEEIKKKALALHCRRQAEKYLAKGNTARAFSHLLVSSKLVPNQPKIVDTLVFTLRDLGITLEAENKYEELFNCYQQALEIFPDSAEIQNNFGAHLFRSGDFEAAAAYFLQALTLNPTFVSAKENLDNISNALMERWHFPMLNDKQRNSMYSVAIDKAVKSGHDVVLDIGTGTGILSMCALRSGAKQVYACEMSKIIYTLAGTVLENNSCRNKVKLFNEHSQDLSIPKHLASRVSLVVTEILDSGLLGEGILPTLSHAWKNLLLPPKLSFGNPDSNDGFGKVIPAGATAWASAIECATFRKQNRALKSSIGGLYLQCLGRERASDLLPYTTERLDNLSSEVKLLTSPIPILAINFNDPEEIEKVMKGLETSFEAKFINDGTPDAIVMWFTLHLDEELSLSTENKTCWEQAVYPIQKEIPAVKDESIKIEVKIAEDCITFSCSSPREKTQPDYLYNLNHCDIQRLNDNHYWQLLINTLISSKLKNCKMLDLTSFPLGALLALRLIGGMATIAERSELEDIINAIALANGLQSYAVQFASREDTVVDKWDIVMLDVVEATGVLKQNILEDITLLRYSSPNAIFIPNQVVVQGILVESAALVERNRLVSDENVLNFKISESINKFEVQMQLDVNMDQIPYKLLSDPIQLFEFNFSSDSDYTDLAVTISTKITQSGCLHAIMLWFKLRYGEDYLDTYEDRSVWKQACFMLDKPISVSTGQDLTLKAKCSHSCITVDTDNI